ncbi:MAG: proline--tRNA ligase, partial [Gammaproteobacteria bacterium]
EAGIETLFDDRQLRPGVMFADMDMIGIPHRLVMGERGLDAGTIEYKGRRQDASQNLPREGVVAYLQSQIRDDIDGGVDT